MKRQLYCPETGGRSFEENQQFFEDAKEQGTWSVNRVGKGEYKHMPQSEKDQDGETAPLLGNGS